MKYPALLIVFLIALSFSSFAQKSKPQKKAEKEFLSQLNKIISQKNVQHHWLYEEPYTVVQPFQIDTAGILSVTIRYTTDSSWFLHRMEMPVKSIVGIAWDMYVIIESEKENVKVLESKPNSSLLKETFPRNIFHIAIVADDNPKVADKLRKSWAKLAPYYGIDYQMPEE